MKTIEILSKLEKVNFTTEQARTITDIIEDRNNELATSKEIHRCTPGQEVIATEKTRDRWDLIIVQEKLDGSNVGVAKVNDQIVALTRTGYLASNSKYYQHRAFAEYVKREEKRFYDLLKEGERVAGEWLLVAH